MSDPRAKPPFRPRRAALWFIHRPLTAADQCTKSRIPPGTREGHSDFRVHSPPPLYRSPRWVPHSALDASLALSCRYCRLALVVLAASRGVISTLHAGVTFWSGAYNFLPHKGPYEKSRVPRQSRRCRPPSSFRDPPALSLADFPRAGLRQAGDDTITSFRC